MQKIITATKKEFSVKWCGVSAFDNALRFEIVNSTMSNILPIVTNPAEIVTLTYLFDEHETVYTGYTKFKGVDQTRGSVIVALMEGT